MTVDEIRGSVGGSNEIDRFPIGMRVLAVDDDPTCLKLLDALLRKCQYQVTTANQAITALKMLRENRNRFDLIISDVYMPDMDGFKLLELVGLEMDLPVIMLSGNSDPKLVMKGITHGACDYLVKPVRLEELRNIWQHVIRKKVESKSQSKSKSNNDNNQEKSNQGSEGGQEQEADQNGKVNRKRKEEDEDVEENDHENDDSSTQKKPRVVWSIDLHRKFVSAVNQLGLEKAVPKRILDLMNVEGLTRENVASHLQKYRLYLKRISQQANMVVAFGGSKDASSYMRMSQLDGLGDFQTFSGSARLPNASLSSYSPSSMLSRLNSATGMTLHSLTSPSLTQQSQNLTKFQPVMSSTLPSHQKSNLFQGIPSSFDLDLFQQSNKQDTQLMDFNSIDESRIFMCSNSFMGPSVTKSESLNLVSTGSSFLDQSGLQPSNFSSNSMPMSESFHAQLPHNTSQRYAFSAATASVPIEPQIGGIVGDIVRNVDPFLSSENHGQYKQDYTQYSNNGFSPLAASAALNGGGLCGSVSQTNGGALTFTQKSNLEQRMGSGEDLQGGFVANNRYDPLDDLMNGIMKREQEPLIVTDGEFRFDPYSFGSCI